MKYIIFEDFSGKETPLVFPDRIMHEELREQIPYARVLSAGYVHLKDDGFVCSGKSIELGAVSKQEDSRIIASHFAADE